MSTHTGKKARRTFGTKISAKRAKRRKGVKRSFGKLTYSVISKSLSPPSEG